MEAPINSGKAPSKMARRRTELQNRSQKEVGHALASQGVGIIMHALFMHWLKILSLDLGYLSPVHHKARVKSCVGAPSVLRISVLWGLDYGTLISNTEDWKLGLVNLGVAGDSCGELHSIFVSTVGACGSESPIH